MTPDESYRTSCAGHLTKGGEKMCKGEVVLDGCTLSFSVLQIQVLEISVHTLACWRGRVHL